MTKKYTHVLPVVAALVLTLGLGVASVHAQISFGKMRDASEKNKPSLEEDGENKFDVSPDDSKKSKPKTSSSKAVAAPNKKASAGKDGAPEDDVQPSQANDKATPQEPVVADVEDAAPQSGAKPAVNRRPATRNNRNSVDSNASAPSVVGKPVGENGHGPLLGRATSHKYRAGMIFQAQPGGTCANVFGSAPVPMEFPEQKVRTLEENFPKSAKVKYRDLKEGGARQLVFNMRELRGGMGVEASALFEVTRYPILPPAETDVYSIPKSVTKEIRPYLRDSKYMESNSKTIRSLAKETTEEKETAWEKVDAILSYVRDNIQYKEVLIEKQMRGALAALRTHDGDCEDMSALFISMCRAIDVPARLVRVPGHCWAEFYLVDDEKQGFWFPAQVAGTEALGSLQDTRVILQKGDSFRIPEEPREEQLYVKELFMGTVKDNGPDPKYQFIQETDAE